VDAGGGSPAGPPAARWRVRLTAEPFDYAQGRLRRSSRPAAGATHADIAVVAWRTNLAFMLRPTNRRSRAALRRIERNESWRTILIALSANIVIAIAKLISG